MKILPSAAEPSSPYREFDSWRDVVCTACGPLQVVREQAETFEGTLLTGELGGVRTSTIAADPHTVVRTDRLIRRATGQHLYVCRMVSGEALVSQDGRQAVAGPGELIAFDSSRAYTLSMRERFHMVTLMFSHQRVGLTPNDTRALTATRWAGDSGIGALLAQFLVGLGNHGMSLDETTSEQLGNGVASLVATMLAAQLRREAPDPAVARHALMLRIQAYVRDHLADPRLSPTTIAQAHNVSVRYLQKLFQDQGTSPASWIRDERLSRSRSELLDPRFSSLTVALIGERSGLYGASHFSRLFRDRYGVTPREYRKGWRTIEPGLPAEPAAATAV